MRALMIGPAGLSVPQIGGRVAPAAALVLDWPVTALLSERLEARFEFPRTERGLRWRWLLPIMRLRVEVAEEPERASASSRHSLSAASVPVIQC